MSVFANQNVMSIGLVVPCYNEAQRIDFPSFAAFLANAPAVTIIFVDDGSTDDTKALLEQFVATCSAKGAVLALTRNRGKAEAVRAGLQEARARGADVIGFWDADLATPLSAVFDLLTVLDANPHVDWVLGSRVRVLGRDIERNALRHYLGRVFATAASLTLGMPVYDTQCGAKLFRATRHLDEVIAQPFLSRWIFDVEMIARFDAVRARDGGGSAAHAIHEYPLARWVDVGKSKIKARHFVQAFFDLMRISRMRRAALPKQAMSLSSPSV